MQAIGVMNRIAVGLTRVRSHSGRHGADTYRASIKRDPVGNNDGGNGHARGYPMHH